MFNCFRWFFKHYFKNRLKSWAVRSWVSSRSSWFLIREEEILLDGSLVYNLILEYAPGESMRSLMERR
ncbi:hypothetical protein PVL29_012328 [Vitis rotundifolia]|uniref:Uncharacterized protein n=1 Tax=Vitis rotundifolia TaxID=103349 RepID=A0AA38ZQN6_VITRO|nr:hypothetical protein PVL29_012328 [Vitis rotundifolia]